MTMQATFGIRLLASILILVPSICGLILHVLLGFTLYSGWKTFRENSFYWITLQVMWCDVYALVLDLYAAFPMTLTGVQYMGNSVALYYAPFAFEGIAFNGIFMLSFLLTLNRFLLFIFPKLHYRIFTIRGTKYFYFWFNCSNADGGHFHYKDFFNAHSFAVPCLMMVMYLIVFAKLKLLRHGPNADSSLSLRQQIKYLVQTLLICLLIFVENVGFHTIPYLKMESYLRFYINILQNIVLIANNMITPIVIFSFNYEVRQQFKLMFTFHHSSTKTKSLAVVGDRVFHTSLMS